LILNHLNLTVSDVDLTRDFLMTYFGLLDMGGGNRNRAFLQDARGTVISIFKGKDAVYPALFHLGFGQPSRERVDEINARLKADGYEVNPPAHSHSYTFYVRAPDGFLIEVFSA
jgi:lactoylglutathione lyase